MSRRLHSATDKIEVGVTDFSDARDVETRADQLGPRSLRIGHLERDSAVRDLGKHLSAGRLTLDEFEHRTELALQATTADGLSPLFADLPWLGADAAPPAVAGAARPGRACRISSVRWALLAPWVFVNALMILIWATSGGGYFWPIWVMGPWGLAILPASVGHRRRARQPVG